MKPRNILLAACMTLVLCSTATAQNNAKGYYKDIFMDSGIMLTSRVDLPAARYLGLEMEAFISAVNSDIDSITQIDTIMQRSVMVGNALDENGVLLYPDGEPRFRMIYMNGGRATKHGSSLGEEGRDHIRQFIANGGSYVGTCAGAFIASSHTATEDAARKEYLGIWPGITHSTHLENSYTGHFIEKNSPLLKYYDFGGDGYIANVRHNGGCYGMIDGTAPKGTEILCRYDGDTLNITYKGKPFSIHKQVSVWAYKADETSGRVISCGSHPESITSGERLEMMCAMVRYSMDGNGNPTVKGEIAPGESIRMDRTTRDNEPARTRIGDKQYHHFIVNVPKGKEQVTITLKPVQGFTNFDLYLFANPGEFAFMDNALYKNISLGVDKEIVIDAPKSGKLYLSVFCDTTVDTIETKYGTQYTGRVDVLNGVPYIIEVK